MTKQQAPHSPERCAGVPGHKKDAAAGEGNLSTTLSLPRGIREKTAPRRTAPMQSKYKKQQK